MSFKSKIKILSEAQCFPVNCRICGGEIIPALYPAVKGGAPQGVIRAEYSGGLNKFYLCDGEGLYISSSGANFIHIIPSKGDAPVFFEDIYEGKEPCEVILNGEDAVLNRGIHYRAISEYGANLSCGAMHCGRLFGADKSNGLKLCWSGEGGFEDWTEGLYGSGSLTLDPERGEILDLLGYGEKLVAVRKFGLTVLSMYGTPENFSVKFTDADTDEIYKGTACVVGGELVFCTASGLRSFDGSRIKELAHVYSEDISNPSCAVGLDGKYFLCCQSKTLGGGAVLCYDLSDGGSYLINVSADAMCSADKVYVYNQNGAFALEKGGEFWVTADKINFGSGRAKTVTEIFIDGKADVEISNGRVSRVFHGAEGIIRPRLRGESFKVKISGSERVRAVTATAEECDAV